MANTNTHTHSVPRDTQGGWRLVQGWDEILTRVSVAPPLIKSMGNEHREYAVCGWESRQWQTHKHTHTHTQCHRDIQGGWSFGQ